MHSRRLACFFVGLWLGGSLLMVWMAGDSFRSVDRMLLLPDPAAAVQIKALGPGGARTLFRYQVSEQNRAAFETWERIQIALGLAFFLYLLLATKEGKFPMILVLLMLAVVTVQRFVLTPELIGLGRNLDFAPATAALAERAKFRVAHIGYTGFEIAKWLIGLVLAAKMAFGRAIGLSGSSRDQVDPIDKRNYRHVNR
jgi:hypothetical protein